jgi:hypothetical protein
MDLFPLSFYREYKLHRFDIAYVAETYDGDKLHFHVDDLSETEKAIRVTKSSNDGAEETEVVRCSMIFKKN